MCVCSCVRVCAFVWCVCACVGVCVSVDAFSYSLSALLITSNVYVRIDSRSCEDAFSGLSITKYQMLSLCEAFLTIAFWGSGQDGCVVCVRACVCCVCVCVPM